MVVARDQRAVTVTARAGEIEATGAMAQRVRVGSKADLERKRHELLVRLHNRSDDFAATKELQVVTAELTKRGPGAGEDRQQRLRLGGLSFWDRLRAKRRARSKHGVEP